MKRIRNINCRHYKGDGYLLPLIGLTLSLCDGCYLKAENEIRKQRQLEKSLKN